MTEWMRGWKTRGWRTTTGEVKNVDLMQRLDELASRRDVRWTWVRGHAGDPLNERADRLVARGRARHAGGSLDGLFRLQSLCRPDRIVVFVSQSTAA